MKITLSSVPLFTPLKWKEVNDWLNFVASFEETQNYYEGTYKELKKHYVASDTTDLGSTDKLAVIVGNDVYNEICYKFPPPLDLLLCESVLLFNFKYSGRVFKNALLTYYQYVNYVSQDELYLSILNGIELGEEDLDVRKKSNELSFLFWNLTKEERFHFTHHLLNSCFRMATLLLKKGMRTIQDFNEIISPRITSLTKYSAEKFHLGESVYETKLKRLYEQNFIVNERVLQQYGLLV